jgi:electron transfer flavoprotein beta subunit
MKVVVLVKEVPDTWGDRQLDLQTGILDRDASDRVLDEINERAIEFAVSLVGQDPGTEVTLLSMGQAPVAQSLRKGLAQGATRGVHILDERLAGADMTLTAEALAGAIRREGFDLVVAGASSTDGAGGVIPAMVAEHLNVPHLTSLNTVEVSGSRVSGERPTATGLVRLAVNLPAVISVTDAMPEARLPSFKSVAAAKKKTIDTLTLADLGIDPDSAPRSIMVQVAPRPARSAGVKIIDQDDAGEQLVEFLVKNRLV